MNSVRLGSKFEILEVSCGFIVQLWKMNLGSEGLEIWFFSLHFYQVVWSSGFLEGVRTWVWVSSNYQIRNCCLNYAIFGFLPNTNLYNQIPSNKPVRYTISWCIFIQFFFVFSWNCNIINHVDLWSTSCGEVFKVQFVDLFPLSSLNECQPKVIIHIHTYISCYLHTVG